MQCVPAGEDIRVAISKATGTPVVFEEDAAATKDAFARIDASNGTDGVTVTLILGYLWENENYSGTSIYFTTQTSNSTPCLGITYGFPYLGNYGWHDRADSMQRDSGCLMNLYSDPNYGGVQTGYQYAMSSLGLLHDAGDSLVFGQ